jgi:hypothetical protein
MGFIISPAFKQTGPETGPAHRAGHLLPADWRPGMQQHAAFTQFRDNAGGGFNVEPVRAGGFNTGDHRVVCLINAGVHSYLLQK